jgi:hypothetical protein
MGKLRIGILDLLTNRTQDAWFERHVMLPNFASIMPQCVAVWAEELGCDVFYETYSGGEDLSRSLPLDLDVVFISCFSRASFLAYALSAELRAAGTVTVLGGPHARSFAEHARAYFDYVCQLTDKETILSILRDCSHHHPGVVLDAESQPASLPGVEARARFIDVNLAKNAARRFFRTIPMIGSLGCPYSCSFCVDAPIPYQTLPYDALVEDLRFVRARYGEDTCIFWHDPNFGVRFDQYMGLIEESGSGLMHGGESSLSLLGEENLKRMKRNRWVVQVPGIESWYDFNGKGAASRTTGLDKVRRVADHVNTILAYVPYVQTNFVFGLDSDVGDEPFELTKTFVDLAPGAFPGYSLVTDFQNAPLSSVLADEGRTFPVPFPFLDNTSATNVRLKHYGLRAFYDSVIGVQRHTWSARAMARRARANSRGIVKVVNAARAVTEGRWRLGEYEKTRAWIDSDPSYLRSYLGEQREPPQRYFDVLRRQLGRYWAFLPEELKTPSGFVRSLPEAQPSARLIPARRLHAHAEPAVRSA